MSAPVELFTQEWPPADASDASDASDARVAVLVHGIKGWSKTWWRVGPALAERGWRVIAVDQRAHGRSPAGGAATLEDLARDLEAAIERHTTPPVDLLLGHSLGAAVAQRLISLNPGIARRVVLEDPPGLDRVDDTDFQERLGEEVAAARDRPDEEIRRELAENPAWLEEDARQDVEGRGLTRTEVLVDSLRLGREFHVSDLARELAVPARYILASEERSVMQGDARRRLLANLPSGSDAVVLEGGHTLHRDQFDAYLVAVLEFVG
jgi:pimeloyl-ACP methyl ester carboxylesterase